MRLTVHWPVKHSIACLCLKICLINTWKGVRNSAQASYYSAWHRAKAVNQNINIIIIDVSNSFLSTFVQFPPLRLLLLLRARTVKCPTICKRLSTKYLQHGRIPMAWAPSHRDPSILHSPTRFEILPSLPHFSRNGTALLARTN
jgi:hypothetical protein